MKKNAPRVLKRDTLHLSQALLLEETGVPRLVRYVIISLTLIIAAFITWASLTKIDEVAVATGKIIPSGHVKLIQSEDGGIVSEILVMDGQAVEKGQKLVLMDPTVSVSTLDQQKVRRMSLQLREERLQALINDHEPDFGSIPAKYSRLAEQQSLLYAQKKESLQIASDILNNQIKQYEAEYTELDNSEQTLRQQYKLLEDEYKTYEDLYKKELVGKREFFSIKRQFLQVQELLNQIPMRRIQLTEKLTETKNRLLKLKEEALDNWMTEQAGVQAELAEIDEIIKRFEMDVYQLSIKAPTNGVVHNVQVYSAGEVVKPGATLMELVPVGEKLVAEVRISSRDIGHVSLDQTVTVKLTAYDFSRYGGMKGKLVEISPTTIVGENGSVFYKGIVELDKNYIVKGDKKLLILPGMTVQADIKTGNKTLIGYFLKPITLSLQQSFHER
ncbi:HlyD family type I secretion periplasmic adaptor subunit [Desulfovibrio inopinatus]|uniref:HlyD family type I secretion periplasmic adaptor subunit n=1 Tax=Desulfovibrio inopinatus TaxID=102109 RepID=UPI000421EADB|nr:HlyD family type I secretion periplasmic adaptor subunit [Desulfovibrio inopinatus]